MLHLRLYFREWNLLNVAVSSNRLELLKRLSRMCPQSPLVTWPSADEIVKRVHDTGDAVVVVQDGEPAAVLVGADEFAMLRGHRSFLAAVEEGLADASAGRVLSSQELKESLEKEFGPIAWQ